MRQPRTTGSRRMWKAGAIVCLVVFTFAGCGGSSSGTGGSGGSGTSGGAASDGAGGSDEQLITTTELNAITGDDYLDASYNGVGISPGNSVNNRACTTKYPPNISCLFTTEPTDPTDSGSAFDVRVWCGSDGMGRTVEVSKDEFSSDGAAEAVPGLGSEAFVNIEQVPQLGWKNGKNICSVQVASERTDQQVTDPKAFAIAVAKIVDARLNGENADDLVKPIEKVAEAS